MRPVAHGDNLPVLTAPASWKISDSEENLAVAQGSPDQDFVPEKSNSDPHLISQVELNDLVHDLYLSNSNKQNF